MTLRTILAALVLTVAASQTHAALLTWQFEAVVRGTRGPPALDDVALFPNGRLLRGSISFETATPDAASAPGIGVYQNAVTSLHLEYLAGADWFTLGDATGGGDIVTNNPPLVNTPPSDTEVLNATLNPSTFDGAGAGTSATGVRLDLLGLPGAEILTGEQMLLPAPPLSTLQPFNLGAFLFSSAPHNTGLFLKAPGGQFDLRFEVAAQITLLSEVPEPTRAPLAGGALLALACVRRIARCSIAPST